MRVKSTTIALAAIGWRFPRRRIRAIHIDDTKW